MYEIRIHGRGGQGAVVASEILATAAFYEGLFVSSFPYFGVERRGAPVTAFTRIDNKPIRVKSQIYSPDYVIVLDQVLLQQINVETGLKEAGGILINTIQSPEAFKLKYKVATVNATEIAIKNNLGAKTAPIVNTAILGAFARVSGIVSLESVIKAVKENLNTFVEANANAVKEAYDTVQFSEEVN